MVTVFMEHDSEVRGLCMNPHATLAVSGDDTGTSSATHPRMMGVISQFGPRNGGLMGSPGTSCSACARGHGLIALQCETQFLFRRDEESELENFS